MKINNENISLSIDEIEKAYDENVFSENHINSIPKYISGILSHFSTFEFWKVMHILDNNKNRKDSEWINVYQAIDIVNNEKKLHRDGHKINKKKRYKIDDDLESIMNSPAGANFFED